jgi:DNA polymerase-3 subunit gamma/tau
LIRCWDACAGTLEKEVHLKNAMLSCKPVLLDGDRFEVTVHNPMQKEELVEHSLPLLKALREQLNNSRIQMLIRVEGVAEKKRAFTDAEKYESLCEINPLLSRLKEEFDLTIE